MSEPARDATVDPGEVARFSALAQRWWDTAGELKVLHRFNPVRLAYLRARIDDQFGRDAKAADALAGLRVLDVGCGGGLLAEPLARLGANVVGIDPAEENIAAARAHAAAGGLAIDYRAATAETLAAAGERFDIVLAMEVVEHVTDPRLFLATCAQLLAPRGLLVAATLNRTLKSFALAVVGAEYVLRWLPPGTHRWDRFVTPEELRAHVEAAGLAVLDTTGVTYHPLADSWRLSSDLAVNYFLAARREG